MLTITTRMGDITGESGTVGVVVIAMMTVKILDPAGGTSWTPSMEAAMENQAKEVLSLESLVMAQERTFQFTMHNSKAILN